MIHNSLLPLCLKYQFEQTAMASPGLRLMLRAYRPMRRWAITCTRTPGRVCQIVKYRPIKKHWWSARDCATAVYHQTYAG